MCLVAGIFFLRPQPVHGFGATDYQDNLVTDYGIPGPIVQVLLDNSLTAAGTTPAAAGKTPANFTIGDVQKLSTISLATRSEVGNTGTSISQPNETVGKWVSHLVAGADYNIDANVYALNVNPLATPSGSLLTGELAFDSHGVGSGYQPAFNFLLQIIASAQNATVVDLTGVTAQISDSSLAQNLLCLFQTTRLSQLQTLLLGNNNLGALDSYLLASTLFAKTADQHIATLDLSHNNITQVAWGNDFSIMADVTKLNLLGNAMTAISGTLDAMLSQIVNNAGTADLSSAELNTSDYNTMQSIVRLINSATGSIQLSDASINAIILAIPDYNPYYLNRRAILSYLNQLSAPAVAKLLADNPYVAVDNSGNATRPDIHDAELRAILGGFVPGSNENTTGSNAIQVIGSLSFGVVPIGKTVVADGTLHLTATLEPGAVLTVSMSPWTEASGGTAIAPTLTIPVSDYWAAQQLAVTSDSAKPSVLYTNLGSGGVKLAADVTGVQFAMDTGEISKTELGTYQSELTWTVACQPTSTIK